LKLPPLRPALLLRRYKRFLADVRLPDGQVVTAHLPNPGRMTSCLAAEETPVLLSEGRGKLPFVVELARPGEDWVLVHPGRANAVVGEAIAAGRVPELVGYHTARAEQRYAEDSRVDWLLEGGRGTAYVEIKSATLVRGRRACFPDAVTSRGVRHLEALMAVVARGARGILLFHVGRADADAVSPADDIDPAYGIALRRAARAGVEILAYRADITPPEILLGPPLPVILDAVAPGA
jgi:sugar fermentation stimulation protein A